MLVGVGPAHPAPCPLPGGSSATPSLVKNRRSRTDVRGQWSAALPPRARGCPNRWPLPVVIRKVPAALAQLPPCGSTKGCATLAGRTGSAQPDRFAHGSPVARQQPRQARRQGRPPAAPGRAQPHASARNTNGGNFLPGIDGRSHQARRIYDITAQVATDLGGADRLSETRISLVRRFAALSVLLEEQEIKIANGEPIDVGAYSHMSSTLVRLAQRIGLKRAARDVTPTPSVADYLAHVGGQGSET